MKFPKPKFYSSHTILLFIAFIIYSIAAIKSEGYYHEDEHYQLIGFAEYRLGHTSEVAWEYKARIRSSLQPVICMGIFQLLGFLGIEDPFALALILRALTAFIVLSCIWLFATSCLPELNPKYHLYFLATSFLLWFLPFLNVRFSSETWSGLCFISALAFLNRALKSNNRKSNYIVSGALMGAAFIFRFQGALFFLGILSWLLIIKKTPVKSMGYLCTGFFAVMLVSVIIDAWFYQQFTFVFYRYIQTNVVHQIALAFGKLPWYYIPLYIIKAPSFVIGIPILIAFLFLIVAEPRSIFVWSLVPFITVHLLSPHKELRFLFPLANLVPILLFTGIQRVQNYSSKSIAMLSYVLGIPILLINGIALITSLSKGAGRGNIEIAGYIHRQFPHEKVNLITSYQANPFNPYMKFTDNFYEPPNLKISEIPSVWASDFRSEIKEGCVNLLILAHHENTGAKTFEILKKANFHLVKDVLPQPFAKVMDWYDDSLGDDPIFYGRTEGDHLMLFRYKP